jgi:subtilisin-like proprotein convertase family protein
MANLVAGWNDLSVDYNQLSGAASLHVQLDGPDLARAEIPADRLRPVEPADDRLAFAEDNSSHFVSDGGGASNPGTAVMTVGGYAGETVTSIDLTYEIDAKRGSDLKVDLESPAGPSSRLTIRDSGTFADGDHVAQLTVSSASPPGLAPLLGGAVNGAWKLHVYDTVNNIGSSLLRTARITLHTTGGPDKVARAASWTSAVLDAQTPVFAIDSATWDERLPAGATLDVRVRTCQLADCSDDQPFSPPVTQATPFMVTPGRYLRVRVNMTSNGALEPELRSLHIMYRRDQG